MHSVWGSLKHHPNLVVVVVEGPRTEEAFRVEVAGEGIRVKEEEEEGVEVVGLACQQVMEGEAPPERPDQHGEKADLLVQLRT